MKLHTHCGCHVDEHHLDNGPPAELISEKIIVTLVQKNQNSKFKYQFLYKKTKTFAFISSPRKFISFLLLPIPNRNKPFPVASTQMGLFY